MGTSAHPSSRRQDASPGRHLVPDTHFTELGNERVVLRRFRLADVTPLVSYRTIPEVARFQGWQAPYSKADGEGLIREMMSRHPDTEGAWFQFAVALRSNGELIGECAAQTMADDARQAEIGYTIAPAHQGHGYATEAVHTLLGYLFEARGKHRVIAYCDVRNVASARVLDRLAMRREGHMIESTWWKCEWTDEFLYAMLDREWSQRR
jgi:RimJ/RimL family protein N-acetyltransferase